MAEALVLFVNDERVTVPVGSSVAAAVLSAPVTAFRFSVSGEPRAPLCGMGICFECRVTINDIPHARSCQIECEAGMRVNTESRAA